MLVNLIKNSIEAIDELVHLGELNEVPRIQVKVYIDGDFLCLGITDNGIGLAPEDIDKIYSAGFTTKDQGSGLGLHSSANFVISSGGQIEAISEGKGTTLHIRLPISHN
jgi:signal transduction histidine kinase